MALHLGRPGRGAFPSTTYHLPLEPASSNHSPKEKAPGKPGGQPLLGAPLPVRRGGA